MAKKNLHTKRGVSNEHMINPFQSTTSASSNQPAPAALSNSTTAYPRRRTLENPIMDNLFNNAPSLPRDFLQSDFNNSTDLAQMYDGRSNLLKDSLERSNSNGFLGEVYESASSSSLSRGSSSTMLDPSTAGMENGPFNSMGEKVSYSASLGDRGFSSALFSSESLLGRYSNVTLENPVVMNDFFPPLSSNSSVNPPAETPEVIVDPTIPLARLGISGGDQNPPCNTLYVGNLPMDASEEELRQMFSQCAGYKRLCFKNKSNGPMCFVEVFFL
jgi:hypothetical protein